MTAQNVLSQLELLHLQDLSSGHKETLFTRNLLNACQKKREKSQICSFVLADLTIPCGAHFPFEILHF